MTGSTKFEGLALFEENFLKNENFARELLKKKLAANFQLLEHAACQFNERHGNLVPLNITLVSCEKISRIYISNISEKNGMITAIKELEHNDGRDYPSTIKFHIIDVDIIEHDRS